MRRILECVVTDCMDPVKLDMFALRASPITAIPLRLHIVAYAMNCNNSEAVRVLVKHGARFNDETFKHATRFMPFRNRDTTPARTVAVNLLREKKFKRTRDLLFALCSGLAEMNLPVLVLLAIYDCLWDLGKEETILHTRWEIAKVLKLAASR